MVSLKCQAFLNILLLFIFFPLYILLIILVFFFKYHYHDFFAGKIELQQRSFLLEKNSGRRVSFLKPTMKVATNLQNYHILLATWEVTFMYHGYY